MWDQIKNLKQSINGNVQPQEYTKLSTGTLKVALSMHFLQVVFIALWWSIAYGVFYPWMFTMTSFLQVGWFWNKVTESWRRDQIYTSLLPDEPVKLAKEESSSESEVENSVGMKNINLMDDSV